MHTYTFTVKHSHANNTHIYITYCERERCLLQICIYLQYYHREAVTTSDSLIRTHTHLYTFTSTQTLIHSIKNDEKLITSMNSVRSECTSCWYATTLTSITLGLVSSTLECMKINLQTWCREQRPKETEVGAKAGVLDNHPV